METYLIKAAQLMLAFAILVIVHEFGHYIFARIFGVKVEKFYLFFNPWFSLFKYKPKKKPTEVDPDKASWRDTEYGIGWLPFGGYVKIAGMIDESMDKEQLKAPVKPWEFRAKPAYQRLLIMVAGVLFNFILAIIIYAGIAFSYGEEYIPFRDAKAGMNYSESAHKIGFQDGDIPLFADGAYLETLSGDEMGKILLAKNVQVQRDGKDTVNIAIPSDFVFTVNSEAQESKSSFMFYRWPVVISETETSKGAEKAGLIKGDKIISVNGVSTPSFELFSKELTNNKGKEVTLEYTRGNDTKITKALLDANGKLGIMVAPLTEIYPPKVLKYSLLESIPRGWTLGVNKLTSYVSQMKLVFTSEGAQSVGGFGSIGSIFPEQWSWLQFWNITAFLSVALAFMNILPIPVLDGGHVMFLFYEIITRRQPNEKLMEYAQMVGMAFLLLLLVYANGNDIYRFFFK